jgi:transketolase
MRNTFINTVLSEIDNKPDIYIITGDAGLGVFDDFRKKYVNNYINLGVAEQNMIGFSAGMAMTGFSVFCYNIIPFLLYRCYEQVRNDICYQKLAVTLVGIGSGVTYAPQGMTHYAVEDIGIARTLPNLIIMSPMDPIEAKLCAKYSMESTLPCYVRLAKRGEPVFHENEIFDISKPQILRQGEKVAVLFHGSISAEIFTAYQMLVDENLYPLVVSVPMLQPLDDEYLRKILYNFDFVISVEEHYINSGLAALLTAMKQKHTLNWNLKSLGIPCQFIHEIKDNSGMRQSFGLSAHQIAEYIKKLYRKSGKQVLQKNIN